MKRAEFLLAAIVVLSTSCGGGSNSAERLGAKNKAAYRDFVEQVLNRKKVDKAGDFIAAEFIDHSLAPGTMGNLANFQGWLREFQAAFPEGNWSLDVLIADGDTLAQSKTFFGAHKGRYLGFNATSRNVSVTDVGVVRFAEGKMVEFWGHFDKEGLARQIRGGVAAKPALKAKPKAPVKKAAPAKKTPTKKPTPKPTPKPAQKKK